jgi:hypothetical protein
MARLREEVALHVPLLTKYLRVLVQKLKIQENNPTGLPVLNTEA